jgi:dihydropyrimidinase
VSGRRLIAGGLVVGPAGALRADVLIEDREILAVGGGLGPADEVIDARGCYVLPGAVDTHVHVSMPSGAVVTVDDYLSATAAAVAGGTTTIVDFAIQQPGEPLRAALDRWRARMDAAWCDVGFHMAVTDMSVPGAGADLAALVAEGVTSFKLFMAYRGSMMVDDRTMLAVMRVAADERALVLVHAEHGDAVELLVADALARGDVGVPWHALTRPPLVEAEATARAIALARLTGAELYVVHVSCADALDAVRRARARGQAVYAETCSHYLRWTADELGRPAFEGAKFVCSPPLRAAGDQDALWTGLAAGELDAVASDHCPFRFADQKALGRDDFSLIPNGVPGVEERVMVLYELGVCSGRLSAAQWVELVAGGPARIFGLEGRKGAVVPGADADLVVFDPAAPRTLGAALQQSRSDYSLYEGMRVSGSPRTVLVSGEVVLDDGRLVGEPRRGYIARARRREAPPADHRRRTRTSVVPAGAPAGS